MTQQALTQLRKHNVSDQTKPRLEYFFHTDAGDKASALSDILLQKGYSANHGLAAGYKKLYVVTGWTDLMLMNELTIVEWTRHMCQIGYKHDCKFASWETNPDQK